MNLWVVAWEGIPPEQAFGVTGGQGSPIVIDTLTNIPYYWLPGTGAVPLAGDGWTYVRLTEDLFLSSSSPVDTGLAFTAEAGAKYEVEAKLLLQAPVPLDFHVVWPSCFSGAGVLEVPDSPVHRRVSLIAGGTSSVTGNTMPSSSDDYLAELSALFHASALGPFSLQLSA